MSDSFFGRAESQGGPVGDAHPVVPDDAADLPVAARAIYVGTGGTIAAVLHSGAEVSFHNLRDGTLLPVRMRRIKAGGTTAANLIALV